jgi:hypothetical protein
MLSGRVIRSDAMSDAPTCDDEPCGGAGGRPPGLILGRGRE